MTADTLGVDALCTWDHLMPTTGDRHADNLEGWTLLAALGPQTKAPLLGPLVMCMSFRNPDLLSLMARTLDNVLGGRLLLGVGAGWFAEEYAEYGYPFGTPRSRLANLEHGIQSLRKRWQLDSPPPVAGNIPILVGGSGAKVTLRIAATYADYWGGFGPLDAWKEKNALLNQWCERVGRNPRALRRAASINPEDLPDCDGFAKAGADLLILRMPPPFNLAPLERLVSWRDARAS